MVGYDRYEGRPACQQLASLYGVLRLYVNFFQPSQKLISKERRGGKVIKKYDQAKTPYQRVLASDSIPEEVKAELRELYQGLDPVALFRQLEFYQDSLWQYAWRPSNEEMKANEALKEQQEARTIPELPSGKNKLPAAPRANSPEPQNRYWRCSGKTTKYHSVKRSWRTRPDPYCLYRRRQAENLDEVDQGALIYSPPQDRDIYDAERRRLLFRALGNLSEQERLLYHLWFVYELDPVKIAAIFGTEVWIIYKRKQTLVLKLTRLVHIFQSH